MGAFQNRFRSLLGRLRYAVLVGVGEAKKAQTALCLIDIKEGVRAAAPRAPDAKMPRDNAERVVAGARALSPNLGERMIAARLFDKSVILRELMPQDLKIEIDQLSREEAVTIARYLAGVVGQAHGRQMDATTLDRRAGTQSIQETGCAVLALAQRRRADRFA